MSEEFREKMKNNPDWEEVHRGMWVYRGKIKHRPYEQVREDIIKMINQYSRNEETRDILLKPYLEEIEREKELNSKIN